MYLFLSNKRSCIFITESPYWRRSIVREIIFLVKHVYCWVGSDIYRVIEYKYVTLMQPKYVAISCAIPSRPAWFFSRASLELYLILLHFHPSSLRNGTVLLLFHGHVSSMILKVLWEDPNQSILMCRDGIQIQVIQTVRQGYPPDFPAATHREEQLTSCTTMAEKRKERTCFTF